MSSFCSISINLTLNCKNNIYFLQNIVLLEVSVYHSVAFYLQYIKNLLWDTLGLVLEIKLHDNP